ncbi:bifunctional glutamate N-acetyltransferase/amino-acid acetyltransferase ArgJ [Hydrogenibacillus schlegelii]|uniref:Arginine biosynthesis bifunctional protein ArgJ n=1 Tax=Hydrogenibacillus schlegelii TaxID=1484 RepID=A0A2T5G9R8_HYDSH|nr:bifunctional glutamate N-acetyltransferase/amino-acid acetyltransferase ArgJ [Hydrogenibacillus schlegelii]PTQ52926.1 MAG: Glutamate N-acetyltransferase [Hydrogenibacillus schlegelii]
MGNSAIDTALLSADVAVTLLPEGFYAGGVRVGIKRKRRDLGWIVSDVPAAAAAVYTQNAYPAAPIRLMRETLGGSGVLRGVIVNSGNANALTGETGLDDARTMQRAFAERIGAPPEAVAVASTGVIGVPLPMDKILAGIAAVPMPPEKDPAAFAEAILTTDTRTKAAAVRLRAGGADGLVVGFAKGSGMIRPNMATMLAFLLTDLAVEASFLSAAFRDVVRRTFNRVSVDTDASTNDMALVLANGRAGGEAITADHPDAPAFREALFAVSRALAREIARDGEGATKLIEVTVRGARDEATAEALAMAVVESPLVKTAVYGEDPNWGRIVAALGKSGAAFNPAGVEVKIGDVVVFADDRPASFDETEARAALAGNEVAIHVRLTDGDGEATAWGCDLTEGYVKINALYRT